jgi:hypothetical protein
MSRVLFLAEVQKSDCERSVGNGSQAFATRRAQLSGNDQITRFRICEFSLKLSAFLL